MAKGETKKTNRMLDQNYNQSQAGYNYLLGPQQNYGPAQQDPRYGSSFRHGNNIVGAPLGSTGNTGISGGGMLGRDIEDARSWSTGMREEAANAYRNMLNQGSPFQRNEAGAYVMPAGPDTAFLRGGLRTMASGGPGFGQDQSALDSWMNFRDTGGIDAGMRNDMRRSATNVIPSIYGNMQADMDRRRVLQGGYSPGYDAGSAALARDAQLRASDASERAEGEIARMVAQGKQFGMSGFSNYLENMRAQEMQNRQFGLRGLGDLESMHNQNQMNMAGLDMQGRLAGASGLAGLYSAAPGALNSAYNNYFNAMQGRDQAAQGYTQQRYQANPQRDWLGTGLSLLGAAGGLMTGLGGMGIGFGGNTGITGGRGALGGFGYMPTGYGMGF